MAMTSESIPHSFYRSVGNRIFLKSLNQDNTFPYMYDRMDNCLENVIFKNKNMAFTYN